jgi:hypothetical protein
MARKVGGFQASAAMSFEEIGRELGVTHQRANQIYWGAIRKLQAQCPYSLLYMLVLREDLEEARQERLRAA